MIRSEDIRDRIRDIDEYLLNKYKENKKIEKRDWRTYEQQLMKRVKETKPYVDFIFLSGQNDVEVAVNIMKHGAFDYVVKNEKAPGRLVKAIDQAKISTKKEKMNKGFTMGVLSCFFLLLLLITAILAIVLVFNLG